MKLKHFFRSLFINNAATLLEKTEEEEEEDSLGNDDRIRILKKIKEDGFPANEVYISVEDFFNGNEDDGSIGANIYCEPPSLKEFYNMLTEIKNAPKTESLLIRIADIEDTEWFFSDMVYISGDYMMYEIKKMFEKLKPDEIHEGLICSCPSNIPQIKSGNKAYSVWWD